MPAPSFAVDKKDRFAFGIWCLQNRGRDPFGDQTRPEISVADCIKGMAKRNVYSFEFHDNDIIPFGASAGERDRCIRDTKKLIIKANAMVSASGRNRLRATPARNSTGRNTTIVVMVDTRIGIATSCAAASTASRRGWPSPRWR